MRLYEAIVKGLQFAGVDAGFGGANENAANLLALKHSSTIKSVVIAAAIADVFRQRRPVILFIGSGAIRINDYSPVAPLPRFNRDPVTFVQRVYPVVSILAMFFAWGVSHA
jgi:hypothetical protein